LQDTPEEAFPIAPIGLNREFLVNNHPYKWRCAEKLIFYAVFWELREQEFFVIIVIRICCFVT
jgi:hypothetical protein